MNMARRRRELNALIALDRKVVRQIYARPRGARPRHIGRHARKTPDLKGIVITRVIGEAQPVSLRPCQFAVAAMPTIYENGFNCRNRPGL